MRSWWCGGEKAVGETPNKALGSNLRGRDSGLQTQGIGAIVREY